MCRDVRTIALLGLVTLAGCKPEATYGTSSRSASWSGNKGVSGIDTGTIATFKAWSGPKEPVEFAVWSDLPSQTGRTSGGRQSVLVEWRLYATDGRAVEIRYRAADGKTGSVEIGDQRFDPASGSLFLIRTDRQPIRIEQMKFDLSRLPLHESGAMKSNDRAVAIKALVESEPRIGDFFGWRADSPGEAPAGKPATREEAIDVQAIERIEERFDRGGSHDPFPPYTEPPIDIEAQPIERR